MRILLTYVLFFWYSPESVSQSPQTDSLPSFLLHSLLSQPMEWPFPSLKVEEFSSEIYLDCPIIKNKTSSHHLMTADMDLDGQEEILFSGPCDPYLRFDIYQHAISASTYHKIFSMPGELIWIQQTAEHTQFAVRMDACCCNYYHTLHIYQWNKGADQMKELYSVAVHTDILPPSFHPQYEDLLDQWFRSPLYLPFRSSPVILRQTPAEDDLPREDPCFGTQVIGNQIDADFQTGTGWILAKSADKLWNLVLIAEEQKPTDFHIAWVKSASLRQPSE